MKRISIVLALTVTLLMLCGCIHTAGVKSTKAISPTQVNIYFGTSPEVCQCTDEDTLALFAEGYNSLKYQSCDEDVAMGMEDMFCIHFFEGQTKVASYYIDSNGICRTGNESQNLLIVSGGISYDTLLSIYNDRK